jgi:RNA polymerase sigma factor (sigma-70 family)
VTDASAASGFDDEESSRITAEARRGRALDRELADAINHERSTAPEVSRAFVHGLGGSSRLEGDAERRLIEAAVSGYRQARAELVESFLPLVGSVARNYRAAQQVTRLELMQEGVVGLLRALERYDPERGVPFWSYAAWWVRQAMQQLVSELTRPVVLSDRALRQLSRAKDAHASLQRELGCEPTLAQLADRSGIARDQLANLITADRAPRGLDEPLAGEGGAVGTFGEFLADPLAEDEYERVVSQITAEQLRQLLSGLSDRERAVLRARVGLDGEEVTLREIAEQLGVSRERVRQVENRALGKLRAAATGEPS